MAAPLLRKCQPWLGRAACSAGAICVAGKGVSKSSQSSSCEAAVCDTKLTYVPAKTQPHLIFGVPKKGRLYEKVAKILEGSGIEYQRRERLDVAECNNLPMTLVFLPAADIAMYVGEGNVDIGITGEDVVAESEVDVTTLMKLGFGKCNLSVQAPQADHITDVKVLAGKRVATSFPNIARKYFAEFEEPESPTQIKCISGSVEASCNLKLSDAIVDLVETGTTMKAAGLEEISVIMRSEAILIANPHTKHPHLVEVIRKRIAGYQIAQSWVMVTYNVSRKNLDRCEQITPGRRSPTIHPLEEKGWLAVSAMVRKADAARVMDELAHAGAQDILLTAILTSRMGD